MVMVEAGGKENGGEEEVAGGEEALWTREWTGMEDMLLVYWCCTLVLQGHSELAATMGSVTCGQVEVTMSSNVHHDIRFNITADLQFVEKDQCLTWFPAVE